VRNKLDISSTSLETLALAGKSGLMAHPTQKSETKEVSRLEHDPRFRRRIEQARNSLRAGRGVRLEDLDE
jgi:hypothetical protein